MKTLFAPCNFLIVKPPRRTWAKLHKLARLLWADHAEPWSFFCQNCKTKWNANDFSSRVEGVSCSNCYQDRIWIRRVRLEFNNWGEQNGGKAEQRGRYEAARDILSKLKGDTK